jgi:hypothetical protein
MKVTVMFNNELCASGLITFHELFHSILAQPYGVKRLFLIFIMELSLRKALWQVQTLSISNKVGTLLREAKT